MKTIIYLILVNSLIFALPGLSIPQDTNFTYHDSSSVFLSKYNEYSTEEIRLEVDRLTDKFSAGSWAKIYCNCDLRNPYKVDKEIDSDVWNQKRTRLQEYLDSLKVSFYLSDKINYNLGKARAHTFSGWVYFELAFLDGSLEENEPDFQKALYHSSSGVELFEHEGRKLGAAVAYGDLATYYMFLDRHPEKFAEYTAKHESHLIELEMWEGLTETYEYRSMRSYQYQRYEPAIAYFRKLLKLRERMGKDIDIAWSLSLIGDYHFEARQDYDSALIYYSKALDLAKKSDNKHSSSVSIYNPGNVHAWILNCLGRLYLQTGKLDRSMANLLEAYEIAYHDPDTIRLAFISIYLGSLHVQLKQYEKATEYLTVGLSFLEESPDLFFEDSALEMKLKAWKHLAVIYEALNQDEMALMYYSKYSDNYIHKLRETYDKNIAEYHVAYETRKKEIENEVLLRDKLINELKIDQRNRRILILLMGIILLGIVVIVIWYRYWLKARTAKMLEKKVDEALEKHKEQQQIIVHQSGLTALGEMAAGIAHEINQPLQSVSLSVERIDYENKNAENFLPAVNEKIDAINSGINKIRKIIDHVRVFSSQQKSEMLESFNINTTVNNALSMVKTQFDNHLVHVHLDLDKNMVNITGNPYKFEQVVVNLLNNARDAVEEKERKSEKDNRKEVGIKTRQTKRNAILEVMDNGFGVKESDFTKIFLPFYTTKEPGKGTGLGLSISHGIIKEFNGTINVYRIKKGGAKFRVTIPMKNKL